MPKPINTETTLVTVNKREVSFPALFFAPGHPLTPAEAEALSALVRDTVINRRRDEVKSAPDFDVACEALRAEMAEFAFGAAPSRARLDDETLAWRTVLGELFRKAGYTPKSGAPKETEIKSSTALGIFRAYLLWEIKRRNLPATEKDVDTAFAKNFPKQQEKVREEVRRLEKARKAPKGETELDLGDLVPE